MLFSPNDRDEFLAAIRAAAPTIAPEPAAVSNAPRRYASPGRLGTIIAGVLVIAAIGAGIFANTYSPGAPSYTLTPQTLSTHDRFYPVTLQASSVGFLRSALSISNKTRNGVQPGAPTVSPMGIIVPAGFEWRVGRRCGCTKPMAREWYCCLPKATARRFFSKRRTRRASFLESVPNGAR